MRAYFQCRKERHAKYEQNKSRQSHLGPEKSQATKQNPGKKGLVVYYWEKIGGLYSSPPFLAESTRSPSNPQTLLRLNSDVFWLTSSQM